VFGASTAVWPSQRSQKNSLHSARHEQFVFQRHVVDVLHHNKEKVAKHMKQKKLFFLPWIVIPLVLAMLLIQAEPVARATGTGRSWKVIPTPNVPTVNSALNGISANSSRDAWAVGLSWNNNTNTSQTLIEHWNGTKWSIVPSPNPNPTANRLNAVFALSTSNVWAVGSAILHWNGTKWAVVPSPDPNGSLFSIAASSDKDIWAVGAGTTGTLTEHWNGVKWSVIPSPTPAGSLDTLWGVTVVSPINAWAVGDYFVSFNPPHNLTMILHWNGIKWKLVPSPSPTSGINVLHSVAAVSNADIWTVGNRSSSNNPNIDRTMTQRWNGTKWSVVSSPNHSAFSNALLSVSVISASDIWAVGEYNTGGPSDLTLTEHWNGVKWSVVASPNGGTDINILESVAREPVAAQHATQNVWAVGQYFDTVSNTWKTLAEYYS
jgi:hypothetical protein